MIVLRVGKPTIYVDQMRAQGVVYDAVHLCECVCRQRTYRNMSNPCFLRWCARIH